MFVHLIMRLCLVNYGSSYPVLIGANEMDDKRKRSWHQHNDGSQGQRCKFYGLRKGATGHRCV